MEGRAFSISICLLLISRWCLETQSRKVLPNLREFRVKGHLARFKVPKEPLSQELRQRKEADPSCGNDVVLELSDARESIFEPSEAELVIGFSTVEDFTLNRELSCEMKDRFTVSFTLLLFQTTFVTKSGHGLLDLVKFTVNSKQVSDPYSTNANGLIHLDRVEKTDEGNIVFYKGNDVIVLNIQDDKNCSHAEEARMREDINQISGREFHKTDYPLPFNYWGCDGLGWNVSFCQKLKEHECELQRVGNDVCTQSQMTERHYCPASVSLVNATGYLYDTMSKFIPSFPLVSFEGEYHDKHHSTGIVYPCLT